jgi:hypothetical protein
VYLEREREGGWLRGGTQILSDGGVFREHELAVLSRGQALRFASASGVAHRYFAVRGRERIEVAVPGGGQSRIVPMERAGWTRFYCSLHQDETWDVFVSPSPHFARLDRRGGYLIQDVPPGEYALAIRSAEAGGVVRRVHVGFRTSAVEPIRLDPSQLDP